MGLFVFVGTAAEDLLEDVFLLLRGLGGVRSVAAGWSARGVGLRLGAVGSRGVGAADAEDLLNKGLGTFAHLTAGVLGGSSVEEGDIEGAAWAAGVCEEIRRFVDMSDGNALGS